MPPDQPSTGDPNPAGSFLAAVPIARPVAADAPDVVPILVYARRAPRDLPAWLALLEAFGILLFAVMGDFLALPIAFFWQPADSRWFTVPSMLLKGVVGTALIVILLKHEGRSLASIGLTFRSLFLNITIGVGAYICMWIMLAMLILPLITLLPQLSQHEEDAPKAIEQLFPPMRPGAIVAFMSFVAVWEEIAFRGFLLTRLQMVFKRWWLTIPAGAFLFALGHIYEGPVALLIMPLLGIALGLLFWWRKSLVPGSVFHAIFNTVSCLLVRVWATPLLP